MKLLTLNESRNAGKTRKFAVLTAVMLIFGALMSVHVVKGQALANASGSQTETAASQSTSTPTPSPTPTPSVETDQKKADPVAKPQKRGSFVIAPIPITSPTFGSGLILGVGYIFQLKKGDTKSQPSTIGVAGAYTSSGTRGGAIGGRLYFAENKYQVSFAFGKGRAQYEYYGIGRIPGQPARSTELRQSGSVFFAEFLRNVGKNIFVGPRFQYRKLTASFGGQQTTGGFVIPAIDLKSTTSAIGFHVQQDRRDNSFYPTKGWLWNAKADFFAKALGSNRTYQTYGADFNGYKAIGKGQVLAYRGSMCSVSDTAPFFDLCFYGSKSDLRGYTSGQFQNRRMFAVQAEYRRELFWRVGVVGFAGVGGVERNWSDFRLDGMLPAGGAGLRFRLDKKNKINYRIDWGYGRAGSTLSMSVSEAF